MTKQATAVFAASNGSDRIQLLINRIAGAEASADELSYMHGPSSACRLRRSMPRSRTVPSVAHAPRRLPGPGPSIIVRRQRGGILFDQFCERVRMARDGLG